MSSTAKIRQAIAGEKWNGAHGLLCILILASHVFSAKISDAAFVEYKASRKSSNTMEKGGDTSNTAKFSEYDIKAKFGAPLYQSTEGRPLFILMNMKYELLTCNYQFTQADGNSLSSIDQLHTLGTGLGAYIAIKEDLAMRFSIGASLNTNLNKFQRVDQKDLLVDANLVFIRNHGIFSYQYGMTTSSSFGAPMILPIFGMTWKPTPWFQYGLLIPYQTSAWFMKDRFSLGITAQMDGNNYRLIRDDAANNYTLSRTSLESSLSLRYRLYKQFHLYSEVGYLIKQTMTMYEPDGKQRLEIENTGSATERMSMKAGLAYSY